MTHSSCKVEFRRLYTTELYAALTTEYLEGKNSMNIVLDNCHMTSSVIFIFIFYPSKWFFFYRKTPHERQLRNTPADRMVLKYIIL